MHLRKHTGVKPFQCENCLAYYISRWNLAKHQRGACKRAEAEAGSESSTLEDTASEDVKELMMLKKRPYYQKRRRQNVSETEIKMAEARIAKEIDAWQAKKRKTGPQKNDSSPQPLHVQAPSRIFQTSTVKDRPETCFSPLLPFGSIVTQE